MAKSTDEGSSFMLFKKTSPLLPKYTFPSILVKLSKYTAEIEALRAEYEESIGEPLQIKNDLKNFLAWFAFELVAYQLVYEIEPELA